MADNRSIEADAGEVAIEPGIEVTRRNSHNVPSHSACQQYGLLVRFMLPLVVTQMVPDLAEQAMNRGITSITSDEMAQLLASYGLAAYVTKLFAANAKLRHIGIVLVNSKKDNIRMSLFCAAVGLILSACLLAIGLTPAGTWFIRDLHKQSQEVSDTTNLIIACLSPVPLIEAVANYYEGGLISAKFTVYAGIAKFADVGMQILFVIVLLFTSTRTEPILVPIFSMYAGYIARLILDMGFWYVLVRRRLPQSHGTEKPLTVSKALLFWLPLTCVRLVQVTTRPLINLVVSRTLAEQVSKEAAAQAIAVLTAVYPTGRLLFSWLNDLRTVPPTFHKETEQHHKFKMKMLTIFAACCTLLVFTINAILFAIPGVGYFIMHKIVGLNEELTEMSLLPLIIFSFICLCVGPRAHLSGILIMKKKTVFLTPSAVVRALTVILFLATLTATKLSGAVLGITVLLLSFVSEVILVGCATLLVKYKPDFSLVPTCLRKKEDNSTPPNELQPLSTDGSSDR